MEQMLGIMEWECVLPMIFLLSILNAARQCSQSNGLLVHLMWVEHIFFALQLGTHRLFVLERPLVQRLLVGSERHIALDFKSSAPHWRGRHQVMFIPMQFQSRNLLLDANQGLASLWLGREQIQSK
jgi:hypothetical protein